EEVFAFFSDARNLEVLTPSWLRLEILPPSPVRIAPGARIRYRLKLYGLPIRWITEIAHWEPPHSFADLQLSVPYHLWHHTHHFEAERGGTRMTDEVRYSLPMGILGRLAHSLKVRRDLDRIFDFRYEKIRELFGGPERGAA